MNFRAEFVQLNERRWTLWRRLFNSGGGDGLCGGVCSTQWTETNFHTEVVQLNGMRWTFARSLFNSMNGDEVNWDRTTSQATQMKLTEPKLHLKRTRWSYPNQNCTSSNPDEVRRHTKTRRCIIFGKNWIVPALFSSIHLALKPIGYLRSSEAPKRSTLAFLHISESGKSLCCDEQITL